MSYNPNKLSKIIVNSLENNKSWIKKERLEWEKYSIEEAKTWFTNKWTFSKKRIIIWLNDNYEYILIDGRHLLEAYKLLKKDIPEEVIAFASENIKNNLL